MPEQNQSESTRAVVSDLAKRESGNDQTRRIAAVAELGRFAKTHCNLALILPIDRFLMEAVPLAAVNLDGPAAHAAGLLRASTRHVGLSPGDRVCPALGRARQAKVITADRSWAQTEGVERVLIR